MLRIEDLTKRYGNELALNRLSLTFHKACINVILGPSGCGKTTLFNCISGLEPFEVGAIYLDEQLLIEADRYKALRPGEIGYVLQGFSLFTHLTVLQNLTLAPKLVRKEPIKQVETRALEILEKMSLSDKASAYPSQLSGGQQQRIAIARAIMMNPSVLLMDEPTNALDPQLVYALEKTLKLLVKEGLTLIISTHHLGFAKRVADYSYYMHQGNILAESPKAELLEAPENPIIQAFIHQEIEEETSDAII